MAHGMDRALGRNAHIAIQPPDQKLADLAGAPMRLVALEADDQALDLSRQLVGQRTGRRERSVRASSPWSLQRSKIL